MTYVRRSERIKRHARRVRLEEPAVDYIDSLKSDFPVSCVKYELGLVREEINIVEGAMQLLECQEYLQLYESLSATVNEIRHSRLLVANLFLDGLMGRGQSGDDTLILGLKRQEEVLKETAHHIEKQITNLCAKFGTIPEPFLMVRKTLGATGFNEGNV